MSPDQRQLAAQKQATGEDWVTFIPLSVDAIGYWKQLQTALDEASRLRERVAELERELRNARS